MLGAVRRLKVDDVLAAIELSNVANWNQTPDDWQRLIRLSPDGCRCIEKDGKIAATATRLNYGTDLAWIGMVLTRPENRREGYARRLMEDAIAAAEEDGIRTLKLDATDQGRSLYESVGFAVEQMIERWERKGNANEGTIAGNARTICDELLAKDAMAFGVGRRDLLLDLLSVSSAGIRSGGYVLSRAGRTARYLGPCVAASINIARELINLELNCYQPRCSWCWDLLPDNSEAVRCAEELGFTRSRTLWRMRRGDMIEHDDSLTYAIAGFELG